MFRRFFTRLAERLMTALIAALYARAFHQIATIIAILLRPRLAGLPLDYQTLAAVFAHMGTLAAGRTPTVTAVGPHTADEILTLARSVWAVVKVTMDTFPALRALDEEQFANLLGAVAEKLAPAVAVAP